MATEEHPGIPAERELLDHLVDGIWKESTRLETVLVVHGYASLRQALARTLEYYGYRACEASSREQALRLAREEHPDVILLDWALGEGEGVALAQEFAGDAALQDVPVLAITSDRVPQEMLRRDGFLEALVMPVEQKDLLAAVDRALERARRGPGDLRLEPADEQCRLALEDRLKAEHLTLFFRFSTRMRVEFRPGGEGAVRMLSSKLDALGIRPEIQMEGGALLLCYEATIAEALMLAPADPGPELMRSLSEAYPELARDPEGLRRRVAELEAEFRRLQRLAS